LDELLIYQPRHQPEAAYDAATYKLELEKRLEPPAPPPMPKPTAEPSVPTEWHLFRVQVRAPSGNDPGQVLEGKYGVTNDVVFVEDDQGQPVAMQRLGPNENAAGLAQKLLREKWRNRNPNAPAGFYDQSINRPWTYH